MQVTVTINSVAVKEKPSNDQKVQSEIIKGFEARIGDVEDLARNLVQPYSNSWCPAVFDRNGVRANDYWVSQQVFAIDIDNKIATGKNKKEIELTPDDSRYLSLSGAIERCKEYGIMPAFVYSSFSSKEYNNKYRIVFVLPIVIEDVRIRNVIQSALMKVFPEADKSCKDASRMYYGGKEIIYQDYGATLDILRLVDAAALSIVERDTAHAARNIKTWCQELGLAVINGGPGVIVGECSTLSIDTIIETVLVSPQSILFHFSPGPAISDGKRVVSNQRVDVEEIRNPQWGNLYQRCEVYRDFINGVDIHNDVTWFVLTNLLRLEGGETKFLEGLQKRDVYDLNKWKTRITYFRNKPYLPSYKHIAAWYPDAAETAQARNIVEAAKSPKRTIYQIEQKDGEPVEVVAERTQAFLNDALNTPLGTFTLIRSDTGIGKTEILVRTVEAPAIVAVPTHQLKAELAQRFKNAGKAVTVAPELPQSLTGAQREKLNRFYAVGMPQRAVMFLRDLAPGNKEVQAYLSDLSNLNRKNAIILTTHARLPFLNSEIETVIIDEDILSSLFPIKIIRRADLVLLEEALQRRMGLGRSQRKETEASRFVTSMLEMVDSAAPNKLMYRDETPFKEIGIIEDTLHDIETKVIQTEDVSSNVLGFFDSICFIKHGDTIYYITRHDLPASKRYIVLSATLSESLYRRAFAQVQYCDAGRAVLAGPLIQDTKYSFSRTSLKDEASRTKRLEYINEIVPDDFSIITYKDFAREFNERGIAYFGGLVGLDKYAGRNIAVIGTPRLNPTNYLLLNGALNESQNVRIRPRDMADDTYDWQEIVRNGFRFWFRTYPKSSPLHEIEMFFIESELIQAVGRARLVRNDCKVIVLSNFPLPGAKLVA